MEEKDYIETDEGIGFSEALMLAGGLGLLGLTRGKVGKLSPVRAVKALAAETPNYLTFEKFFGVKTPGYSYYGKGQPAALVEAGQRGLRDAAKRKIFFDTEYKIHNVSQSSTKAARQFIDEGKLIIGDKSISIEEKKTLLKRLFNKADSRLLEDAAHYVERTGNTVIPAESKLASYTSNKVKFTDDAGKVLERRVGPEATQKLMSRHTDINPKDVTAMELTGRRLYNNTTQVAHMSGKEKSLLLQWLSHFKSIKSLDDLEFPVRQYFAKLGYKDKELWMKANNAMKSLSITNGQLTMSFSPGGKPHFFTGGIQATGRVVKPQQTTLKLGEAVDEVPRIEWTPTDFHDIGGSVMDRVTSSFMKKRVMPIYKTSSRKSIQRKQFEKYFNNEIKKLKSQRKKATTVTKAEKKVVKKANIKEVSDKDLATMSGASQKDVQTLREISNLYQRYDDKWIWSMARALGIGGSMAAVGVGGAATFYGDD